MTRCTRMASVLGLSMAPSTRIHSHPLAPAPAGRSNHGEGWLFWCRRAQCAGGEGGSVAEHVWHLRPTKHPPAARRRQHRASQPAQPDQAERPASEGCSDPAQRPAPPASTHHSSYPTLLAPSHHPPGSFIPRPPLASCPFLPASTAPLR